MKAKRASQTHFLFQGDILAHYATKLELGKLTIQRPPLSREILHYQFDSKLPKDIGEVLMRKFRQLRLTEDEKRLLSKEMRVMIYQVQNMDQSYLTQAAQELLQEIKRIRCPELTIEARGLGAFVALRALSMSSFSQEKKKVIFELFDAPFGLFPKRHAQKIQKISSIHLQLSRECWWKDFPTLASLSMDNGPKCQIQDLQRPALAS